MGLFRVLISRGGSREVLGCGVGSGRGHTDEGRSMHRPTTELTVRALLDRELCVPRVPSLESDCVLVAARPLARTLADLDAVLAGPVTGEAGWRLQVLVSALYHHAGASLPLTEELRTRIQAAQATQSAPAAPFAPRKE